MHHIFASLSTLTLHNCVRKIRSFLTMDACKLLVHSLVMIRLDYCNAVFCGARDDVIRQLERVQRRVARVVCRKYNNDHSSVTELMWSLHWLPAPSGRYVDHMEHYQINPVISQSEPAYCATS